MKQQRLDSGIGLFQEEDLELQAQSHFHLYAFEPMLPNKPQRCETKV